jgi:hypothetical protein
MHAVHGMMTVWCTAIPADTRQPSAIETVLLEGLGDVGRATYQTPTVTAAAAAASASFAAAPTCSLQRRAWRLLIWRQRP